MTPDPASTSRCDGGSATVWVVAAMALVMAALGFALALGGVAVAQRRAAVAADAAALAAAAATVQGSGAACAQAATLARLNLAEVTACAATGPVVTVSVEVPLPGLLAGFGTARGQARAGPAG